MFPSGPAVIPHGFEPGSGSGHSEIVPLGVMRPIRPVPNSVNHTLPSRPAATPSAWLSASGRSNSVTVVTEIAGNASSPTVTAAASAVAATLVGHRVTEPVSARTIALLGPMPQTPPSAHRYKGAGRSLLS